MKKLLFIFLLFLISCKKEEFILDPEIRNFEAVTLYGRPAIKVTIAVEQEVKWIEVVPVPMIEHFMYVKPGKFVLYDFSRGTLPKFEDYVYYSLRVCTMNDKVYYTKKVHCY